MTNPRRVKCQEWKTELCDFDISSEKKVTRRESRDKEKEKDIDALILGGIMRKCKKESENLKKRKTNIMMWPEQNLDST